MLKSGLDARKNSFDESGERNHDFEGGEGVG